MSYYVEICLDGGATAESSARFDGFDHAFDWLTTQKRGHPASILRIVGPLTPTQRGRLGVLGVVEAG